MTTYDDNIATALKAAAAAFHDAYDAALRAEFAAREAMLAAEAAVGYYAAVFDTSLDTNVETKDGEI